MSNDAIFRWIMKYGVALILVVLIGMTIFKLVVNNLPLPEYDLATAEIGDTVRYKNDSYMVTEVSDWDYRDQTEITITKKDL